MLNKCLLVIMIICQNSLALERRTQHNYKKLRHSVSCVFFIVFVKCLCSECRGADVNLLPQFITPKFNNLLNICTLGQSAQPTHHPLLANCKLGNCNIDFYFLPSLSFYETEISEIQKRLKCCR